MENKFYLHCPKCKHNTPNFKEWYANNQQCSECGNNFVDVKYNIDYEELKKLISTKENIKNLWHYFDFLPLNNKENIITRGEGVIPLERWQFLEKFAKEHYNIDIKVHAYRNDLNPATGTFKDVAAAVTASVLKENGIKEFCIASTGNIANAYAHYLTEAGVSVSVFVPQEALFANEVEINSYGQRLFRVQGDYAKAKEVAADYSKKYNVLMSIGNIDPVRVEAKKTMVFEWLRQIGEVPNVYIQALSGGTGPIAIEKAYKDLKDLGLTDKMPRFIMTQADGCAPMVHAWEKAKKNNFPEGWLNDYPIYDNPQTSVPILATGKPATYPIIGRLVKETGGDFVEFAEDKIIDITKLVAYETTLRVGAAAAVALGGFFESLKKGNLKSGDNVLINIGEGIQRSREFVEKMLYTTKHVSSIDDCERFDRNQYKKEVWKKIEDMYGTK